MPAVIIDHFKQKVTIHSIHPAVLAWMLSEGIGKRWCVACSGGADSIFLLCYLYAHFPEQRSQLNVLHFNHKLRGKESDQDEQFVREFCEQLGLPLLTKQLVLTEAIKQTEGNLREARYEFFEDTLKALRSDCLFLGHQKDDILESLLMRLARGSGIEGLSAPHPITHMRGNGTHFIRLRPFLTFSKKAIYSILRDLDIPWREDSSNRITDHFRNHLRNRVIPELQKGTLFDVVNNAARSRQLLEEANEAIDVFLKSSVPSDFFDHAYLDCKPLLNKPKALLSRAVCEWLGRQKALPFPRAKVIDALLDAIREGSSARFNCNTDVFLKTQSHRVSLEAKISPTAWPVHSLKPESVLVYPNGKMLTARFETLDKATKKRLFSGEISNEQTAFLDVKKLAEREQLIVRQWQEGDCYKPLGLKGSKKLQDCFVDGKIPIHERHRLPIIWASTTLLWCPGIPPADDFKVDASTKNVLVLTYRH